MADMASEIYGQSDYQMAADQARDECLSATRKFPPFNSAHEGWAVIAEELDELWDEVRLKQSERAPDALRHEAMQVAAMAIRFMVEIDGAS